MPTYAYACTSCNDRFEVHQSFTDDALTTCERCEGTLRKLFNSVGIVFKGSGFYRTDSRSGSDAKGADSKGSTGGSETKKSDSKSGDSSSSSSSDSSSTSSESKSSSTSSSKATASKAS